MPSQPLQPAFEALRAHLQAELETQLTSIEARHAEAVAEAAKAAERAADDRWSRKFDTLRAEWAANAAAAPARGPATPSTADVPARATIRRLSTAVAKIAEATTLSSTLDRLAAAAAIEAGRTALLIVAGDTLQRWQTSGFAGGQGPATVTALNDDAVLAETLRRREPTHTSSARSPRFAPEASGIAVPLVVGDRTVALLYADDAVPPRAGDAWQDSIVMLAQHAAACLARITATRASQLSAGGQAAVVATETEEDGSARRYARLLVSEIKLYNEAAVRAGRERRDLLARLKPEIDRARRLYEDRVPATVRDRAQLFQQELVHTLAEGDASLLGASA